MNVKKLRRQGLFVAVGLGLFFQCTTSPFGEDISSEPRSIRGRVDLLDNPDDGNVYVWLEGFKIGTRTDEEGFFLLEIPKELTETSHSSLNGIFKLYFYVANYVIKTVDVVVRNGLFVYEEAGLGREGSLLGLITLEKILSIMTIVEPRWAHGTYDGPIDVQVTLQAVRDSITVIYPKSIGGLLGAIILRHRTTNQIFFDIPDPSASTRAYDVIGQEPKSRRMVFQLNGSNFRELFLPVGNYEVIPYFLVEQGSLPQELLGTLGGNVEQIGANFLLIPYVREGGRFRIID